MEYKNVKHKNGIYYYPNDSFNTFSIQLFFLASADNDKAPIYDLLCSYLMKSNQVYKTDNELEERGQELYSTDASFSNFFQGSQKIFSLTANLIAPSVIQDDYLQEAFEFLRDIIKRPDFTNQERLDLVKRNTLADLRLRLSDVDTYVGYMYNQSVVPDEDRKYDDATDIDYITKMVEAVTLEDLEREYSLILNQFLTGYVFGNISEEHFDSFVDCVDLAPMQQQIDFERNVKIVEGDMEISKNTGQSYIYVTYSVEKLTRPQILVLYYIFNSTLGLCYQTLREKYGLVYSSYATIKKDENRLYIYAETDKTKKEKFLQALDEIVADLNNPELLEQLISTAKKEYFANEYTFDEDHERITQSINAFLLGNKDGLDRNEINDAIQAITSEELIQKTKTLKKKNVFMVRGEGNE